MTTAPTRRVPTNLTHPIINSKTTKSTRLSDTRIPAFPEQSPTTALGYCHPGTLSVGIRADLHDAPTDNIRLRALQWLALRHEYGHAMLIMTPLMTLYRTALHYVYHYIALLGRGIGRCDIVHDSTPLTVPLLSDHVDGTPYRNTIEQNLNTLYKFVGFSKEYSEAFAVWYSFHGHKYNGIFGPQPAPSPEIEEEIKAYESDFTEYYSTMFSNFKYMYEGLKFSEIFHGALSLRLSYLPFFTFCTTETAMLMGYISCEIKTEDIHKNVRFGTPEMTEDTIKFLFSGRSTTKVDYLPYILRGFRGLLGSYKNFIPETDWGVSEDPLFKYLPRMIMFYKYDENGLYTQSGENISDSIFHEQQTDVFSAIHKTYFFFESLRQQMCLGVGLQCPFWNPGRCCGHRTSLQRLWDAVVPVDEHLQWRKQGCLLDTEAAQVEGATGMVSPLLNGYGTGVLPDLTRVSQGRWEL